MFIGSTWLVLWLTGVAPRWSAEGVNTMKTNMAVGQVLAGGALLLLSPLARKALRERVGLMAGAVVFLIGALTLSEHLFHWNLGIDQLLASEPAGAVGTASPNRMGPPGSSSLMLLGAGLLFLGSRRARFAAWLGLAVCIINLIPAVGYIYGIAEFYTNPRLTGIAWSTVIALLCLGVGLILARPAQGPAAQLLRDDAGGVLLRRLWPAVVMIPLVLGFLKVLGRERDLFGTAAGTGLLVIAVVVVFSVLLWRSAGHLSEAAEAQAKAEGEVRSVALFPEENPFPVLRATEDGTLLYANPSAKPLLESWKCGPGGRVPEFVREVMRRALEKGGREELEICVGGRTFGVVATPVAGREYVNLYGKDITERKRAEEAVRRERDFSAAVLDTAGALVVVLDREGGISRFNRACVALTGYSEEEVRGRAIWEFLIPPEEREGVAEVWKRLRAGNLPSRYENHWLAKDGSRRLIAWSNTYLTGGSGEVEHVIGTGLDITKQKEFQAELERQVAERTAELRQYQDHLEELVKQRTGELLRATADLKRSNRELEQFAYAASHDLQEPLRAVGGYVRLLEQRLPEQLDVKSRQYIEGAAEGATRMAQQIMDLLELSRVGTRGLRLTRANLGAPLNVALNHLQFTIRAAGARVTSDPLPTLLVDEGQMVQLFQNLIANSLKFRSEGTPEIHVGARREEGRWVIWVRDNGIGIDPQYFERIFQVFQRLHTRSKYPGTGVGLALCRRVVERHGGQIWVESQAGQGATFYFSLPEGGEGDGSQAGQRQA